MGFSTDILNQSLQKIREFKALPTLAKVQEKIPSSVASPARTFLDILKEPFQKPSTKFTENLKRSMFIPRLGLEISNIAQKGVEEVGTRILKKTPLKKVETKIPGTEMKVKAPELGGFLLGALTIPTPSKVGAVKSSTAVGKEVIEAATPKIVPKLFNLKIGNKIINNVDEADVFGWTEYARSKGLPYAIKKINNTKLGGKYLKDALGKFIGSEKGFFKLPGANVPKLETAAKEVPEELATKPLSSGKSLPNEISNVKIPKVSTQKAEQVAENIGVNPETAKTILTGIREAKPIRGVQEAIYTKSRGIKFGKGEQAFSAAGGGEKGFYAKLSQLGGREARVGYESIRGKVGQDAIDSVINSIEQSNILNVGQKITAQRGALKLFGEAGVEVPTESEIKYLEKVLGPGLTEAFTSKNTFLQKFGDFWNLPKSIKSSIDFSGSFRQLLGGISRPKEFIGAFKSQFKPVFSEKAFQELQESITQKKLYPTMNEFGVALTDLGTSLSEREETFASNAAERIPGIGRFIRGSSRAYVSVLNKFRADTFENMVNEAANLGKVKLGESGEVLQGADVVQNIADLVNNLSGRGNIKTAGIGKSMTLLNNVFFSPRLIASRLTMLNPYYYWKLDSFTRKEALKSFFSVLSLGLSILGLAKLAGGEVGTDIRSSDFGKIKLGNTRIDIWGGFQQYIRMLGQLITGVYVSSVTGKAEKFGETFKGPTRADILARGGESKLAPTPSYILRLLKGKDEAGRALNIPKETLEAVTPFLIQDIHDMIANGDAKLLPLEILDVFGVGTQTYGINSKTQLQNEIAKIYKKIQEGKLSSEEGSDIIMKLNEQYQHNVNPKKKTTKNTLPPPTY